MQRTTTTLLTNDKGYGIGSYHPMLDLRHGGQHGYSPDYTEIISSAVHVRRPVVPVLLRAPSGFFDLPNPEYWIGTLKALMEEGYQSIDGLVTGREYSFVETPVGGAGEMQEDIADAKIPRSEVVYNFRERYGMAINRFFTGWGDYLMMHPETKYASVATTGNRPSDMLPDRYTCAMLYYEPDPTHTSVVNAWVGEYMMPKLAGRVEGKRDMTAQGESVDHQIQFTGVFQSNTAGVLALAQSIINDTNLVGANPNYRPPAHNQIDPYVSDQKTGYGDQIERFRATNIRLY